jgi:hypothetical protein
VGEAAIAKAADFDPRRHDHPRSYRLLWPESASTNMGAGG